MEETRCRRRHHSFLRAPRGGSGLSFGVLLLLQGSVLFKAYALDVELKDADNITCLFARWEMNITVMYKTTADEYKSIAFMLPDTVRYDGSSCGNETYGPVLAMEFGNDHSWSVHFTKANGSYQGSILFTYNTNDTDIFPDAEKQGLITTSVNFPTEPVPLDTVFTCQSLESVESDNITQNFWDVSLQVFVEDGILSSKTTKCEKDVVPTTTHMTTTTTTTTTTPTTTTTTTTTPTTTILTLATLRPLSPPVTGNYSLKNGSSVCLLASMGLQLNITQKGPMIINLDPNRTIASGSCGTTIATLTLKDDNCLVDFVFTLTESSPESYFLSEVNITVIEPQNETMSAANRTLEYWKATLGTSYMCRKEETITVTSGYRLNVYNLQVQPFDVKKNVYAIAEDCIQDVDNYFVPILMGASLAGLISLVFMAYFIGRTTHPNAGYEQI